MSKVALQLLGYLHDRGWVERALVRHALAFAGVKDAPFYEALEECVRGGLVEVRGDAPWGKAPPELREVPRAA